jgi:hypothetical protein
MLEAAIIFAATFATVFALGLQSLNVNGRHYGLAAFTSIIIGGSHLVLYKALPGPTSTLQVLAYLLAWPAAITAAIWAHPRMAAKLLGRAADNALAPAQTPPPQWAQPEPHRQMMLREFAQSTLDPEGLGHAVTAEVRAAARRALGINT